MRLLPNQLLLTLLQPHRRGRDSLERKNNPLCHIQLQRQQEPRRKAEVPLKSSRKHEGQKRKKKKKKKRR